MLGKLDKGVLSILVILSILIGIFSSSVASEAASAKKPEKVVVTKITKVDTGFNIFWKKLSKKCDGFELQLENNSSFTKGVWTCSIDNSDATKTGARKLKQGNTYYVRLRAYVLDGESKVFGSWSKKKSIIIGELVSSSSTAAKSSEKNSSKVTKKSTKVTKKAGKKTNKKKVKLKESVVYFDVGQKKTLKLMNAPASKVKWVVANKDDRKWIKVSKKGVVSAKLRAPYKIYAQYKGKKYYCTVYVVGFDPVGYKKLTYYNKTTTKNKAKPIDFQGLNTKDYANVKWKNSNPGVVSMKVNANNSGITVVPTGVGNATITVTFKKKSFKVTVSIAMQEDNSSEEKDDKN